MFRRNLSIDQQRRMLQTTLRILVDIDVNIRWLSIEPLSFNIAPLLINTHLDWAVTAAETNGRKSYQPRPEWVQLALDALEAQGTAVFLREICSGRLGVRNFRQCDG
jgi:protein gp37